MLWTVIVFLAGTLLFRSLREATEDSSTWVTVLAQIGALAALIGLAVLIVRRFR